MWLILAVLAGCMFGARGVLYHWGSQLPLNRNLMLCGVFAMGAVMNLVATFIAQSTWTTANLVGIQMGLFSFIASASMFQGFKVGKASLVAILTSLQSVIVVIFAFFAWGERLRPLQLLVFLLILGGVLLVRYSNDLSLKNLQGAGWALLAMLLFAANDLSSKWSTMLGAEIFPTLVYMFVTGAVCFALWWMRDLQLKSRTAYAAAAEIQIGMNEQAAGSAAGLTNANVTSHGKAAQPEWSRRKTFLTGMAIGTTNAVGMMLVVAAFGLGKTGLVSAVIALNVPIVLLYTRFVVKDRLTAIEVIGMSLTVAGIILLRLLGD